VTSTEKMLARKDGRVGTMIFNNPERHNAVSFDMWQAAARVLDDFAKDDDVRVVVVTGAGGKAFVSGADISKFADERATARAVERYNIAVERIYSSIYTFPKPTIAAIQGYCVGGGLGLAVTCDLRFCTQGSRFFVACSQARSRLRLRRPAALHQHDRPEPHQGHLLLGPPVRCRRGPSDGGSSAASCRRASWRRSSKTMPAPSPTTPR